MATTSGLFSLRRPWFRSITPETLRADAVAGFTNAAIVLPQGVAFAIIAGLPPEYGLYTAMIPPVIAALFGSSTVMISGPTTAISAVLFASLSEFAIPGTHAFVQMALVLTIMVGVMQLAAGIARLGAVIAFVSHSVIVGFTAAAALLIGASQLAPALGLEVEGGGGVFLRIIRVAGEIEHTSALSAFLAIATLASIVLSQRLSRKLPAYLIGLGVGAGLGVLFDAQGNGIAMFSPLPSIIPSFAPPSLDIGRVANLAPAAATIAFVALLEAISIGRDFAHRRDEKYDSNQEIVGQGLSNIIGGFFQCYAGSGSFTRTALNAENGAKTPISAMLAAVFLLVLLLLLAPYIRYIPVPAMAGIILFVAYKLVDFREIRHIIDASASETAVLVLTFFVGITVELEFAIIAGVMASLIVFLRNSASPLVAVLAPAVVDGQRTFRGAYRYNLTQCPQIAVLRIEGPIYFASVEFIEARIEKLEKEFGPRRSMVLYLRSVGTVDLTGADFLIKLMRTLRARGGDLFLIASYRGVVDKLRRTGVLEELGESNLYLGKGPAISACVSGADQEICKSCVARVFSECSALPAPEGLAGKSCEQIAKKQA